MTKSGADARTNAEDNKEDSIGELFGQLVDDAEYFVRSEVKLYRAEALNRLESYKWLFAMGAVGSLLGFCSLVLLLMALVFALAPYTGLSWAAVIVAALALTGAAALFVAIFARIKESARRHDDPEESA